MKTRYLLYSLLFFTILSSCKTQQKITKNNTVETDKILSNNNSLLWRVSGNGLQNPSYIFGTIHIIGKDDFWIGKNLKKIFAKSDEIIMEIDINKMDSKKVALLSVLPGSKSIKDYVTKNKYNEIKKFLTDSIEITPAVFDMAYARLKPFYIEQMIYFKYLGDKTESYETYFSKIAKEQNKVVSGLETFDEQLELLDLQTIEEQYESLYDVIHNYNESKLEMDKMLQDYKAQDITALSTILKTEDIVYKENMLDNRNKNWIPKLEKLFATQKCFIAVGAGHLGGENGILNLLKQKGYTITPISTE